MNLRRLTAADLDAWYAQLRKSGAADGGPLTPNSVRRVDAVLHRALGQAVKWGWITTNPAAAASPPPIRRTPMHIPDPADVARLVRSARRCPCT